MTVKKLVLNQETLEKACKTFGVNYQEYFGDNNDILQKSNKNVFESAIEDGKKSDALEKAKQKKIEIDKEIDALEKAEVVDILGEEKAKFTILMKSFGLDVNSLLELDGLSSKLNKVEEQDKLIKAQKDELNNLGKTLEEIKSQNIELKKGFNLLSDSIREIGDQPVREKRTIVSSIKKFEDNEIKKGESVLSMSRDRKKVIEILGIKVDDELQKGEMGIFTKASQLYEAGNKILPQEIIASLSTEGIHLVK